MTRALASGYRIAMLTLGQPDGLGVPRRGADLAVEARGLTIIGKERELLGALNLPRPTELPFDLGVKAALCAPLLVYFGALTRLAVIERLDVRFWGPWLVGSSRWG